MIAYDPRITIQRDRRARFGGWGFAPRNFTPGRTGTTLRNAGRPPSPCGAATSGKNLREFGPGDPFDFQAPFPVEYRPFEKKMAVLHGQEPGTYGKPALRCDEAPSAVVVALPTPNLLKIVPEMDGGTPVPNPETAEEDLQLLPLNMKWIATYNYARVLDLERQARAAGTRQLKSVQLTIFETINEYEKI